jgi:peptidoglycan/xylan/chitin deacetylase (PgdA/CDA1 family)
MPPKVPVLTRRGLLARGSAWSLAALASGIASRAPSPAVNGADGNRPALISITLDLEMSRNFPEWEQTHWDYEKGNLDEATKKYAVSAARRVKERGGVIHFFCVGRVLEQDNVDWLRDIAGAGHPVGNHTYDHVYVLAKTVDELQFRFKRAPWLLRDMPVPQAITDNIALTTTALKQRCDIKVDGFRTPGGFATGLKGREDVQKILLDQGYKWCSSLYPPHANSTAGVAPTAKEFDSIVAAQVAAQPFRYPTGLVEVPMSPISDIGAFRTGRWKLADFMTAVRLGIEWAIEHRACYDFLAHPSCLGVVDPDLKTIDLICDLVAKAGDKAKLAPLGELAERC